MSSAASEGTVRVSRPDAHPGVTCLTIDDLPNKNAMGQAVLEQFRDAVATAGSDGTRALVVTGSGRYFCSGADLRSIADAVRGAGGTPPAIREALREIYRPFISLTEIGVPTIAAINGPAIGGGLGLALACDIRLATPEAKLAAPFAKLGIHPGMGISLLLPRAIGHQRALEMLYTGRSVTGTEAAASGLILRTIPAETLAAEALALAGEIAAAAPLVTKAVKRTVARSAWEGLDAMLDLEAAGQALLWETEDGAEGIRAFLERRPPRFQGR